jgi:hypothetical protein
MKNIKTVDSLVVTFPRLPQEASKFKALKFWPIREHYS